MSSPKKHTLAFDVVLIGGGVAGLWILNRLRQQGYNAILFEQQALGTGQTIASQGMIHGGVKYTLAGALTGASEVIADMPDYWRSCLAGTGELNLSETKTLSDHFYMWSTESSLSKATAFLASKSLRGRVDAVASADFPPVFNRSGFRGKLYRLVDSVIDTPSLIANLYRHVRDRVFMLDWNNAQLVNHDDAVYLEIADGDSSWAIEAQQFIFSAGKGNAALLNAIGAIKPEMQLRPLQQVMVKHRHDYLLYAHCIGTDSVPRLTISSHRCADGAVCWYLGGQLAEQGVDKSSITLIHEAKRELMALFPWLDWQDAQWATLPVDRAEPRQKNLMRPDKAFIDVVYNRHKHVFGNVLTAWPTKLTLSPHLGAETLSRLLELGASAGKNRADPSQLGFLPSPPIAISPWDKAAWLSSSELV